MLRHTSLILILLFNFLSYASDSTVSTVLGKLTLLKEDKSCYVRLNKIKVKIPIECEYSHTPSILGKFTKGIQPYDEVIIIQDFPMGNACEGGSLYFLGLKSDGLNQFFDSVCYCGGPKPVIETASNRIIFPAHGPNRGDGFIPQETYVYSNGEIVSLDIPVEITFHSYLWGKKKYAMIKNLKKESLDFFLEAIKPNTGELTKKKVELQSKEARAFNTSSGWDLDVGDTLKITKPDLMPKILVVK